MRSRRSPSERGTACGRAAPRGRAPHLTAVAALVLLLLLLHHGGLCVLVAALVGTLATPLATCSLTCSAVDLRARLAGVLAARLAVRHADGAVDLRARLVVVHSSVGISVRLQLYALDSKQIRRNSTYYYGAARCSETWGGVLFEVRRDVT